MGRRRPAWKILGALVAVLLLGVGVFFTWVQAVAARRWAAFEKRVPELVAEAKGRDPRRPVLRGEALPGKSWDDYMQALAALSGGDELGAYRQGHPDADRSKAAEAVLASARALELLRSGARKEEGSYPLEFEKGLGAAGPTPSKASWLMSLSIVQARFLREEGRAQEAVEVLLDTAQFAADIGQNTVVMGEVISLALLGTAMDELKTWMAGSPGDINWRALARSLERLDASFPCHAVTMRNEAAVMAASLLETGERPHLLGPEADSALSAWRFGFSTRLMIVNAADTYGEIARRAGEASRAAWREAQLQARDIEAEWERSRNPILNVILRWSAGRLEFGRGKRAQLALLRAAVAARTGDPAPELDDPFGDKIRYDGARAWSVGPDGINGGGQGDDIVQELPKG